MKKTEKHNVLRMELKKCFQKKSLWLAVGVGCVLALATALWTYKHLYVVNQERRLEVISTEYSRWTQDHEWFENGILEGWLGCNVFSPYNIIFFLLFPLLAAVTYGRSLHNELNSGYAKQILVKAKRRDYFVAKYITVFLAGGFATAVPLLAGLVMAACYLPAVGVDPLAMQTSVGNESMWAGLYFEHPVLYALAYTAVDFVYGGLFACFAVSVSGWCSNGIMALVFPFIMNIAFTKVIAVTFRNIYSYVAGNFINPTQLDCRNDFVIIFLVAIGMFLISTLIYWLNNRKYDLLE